MDPLVVGIASVVLIVILIYCGSYVAITLSIVSFVGVWLLRGDVTIATRMMTLAVNDSIKSYDFASIPTFVLMGFIVGKAGIGTDIYAVAHQLFRRLRGGLGIATVAANAAFAAVTGSSIASASVFTRVSVPEMIRYDYGKRFAVGVVAGSSVLGMLIPPSVMLIIYAFVAEQSVGDMFLAGVVPGLLLSAAFIVEILAMSYFVPGFVGRDALAAPEDGQTTMPLGEIAGKLAPLTLLILIVLGGIYTGVVTASEAGAAGAFVAFLIALLKRRMTFQTFKEVLVDTGHVTAAIMFLIMAATMYSRMLGIAGLPSQFSDWLAHADLSFAAMMTLYVVLLLFLGTIIDTSSIILICAPLFLKAMESSGESLVWFGIVTVVGAEIGLLTPPFGISCFVIKQTLERSDISLNDVFIGAAPFALIMLFVLIALIAYPELSIAILG
ncbi:MAG: TRAP transporter large permease [Bradyrhizobiaceae bacterium]|nr:TRAP transporter large permease [Bradyrhizobiaceae bacterium]